MAAGTWVGIGSGRLRGGSMRDFSRHPRLRIVSLVLVASGAAVAGWGAFAPGVPVETLATEFVPLAVWGVAWLAAGALTLVGIGNRSLSRVAVTLIAAMWGVTGLAHLLLAGDPGVPVEVWSTGYRMLLLGGHAAVTALLIDSTGPQRWPIRGG